MGIKLSLSHLHLLSWFVNVSMFIMKESHPNPPSVQEDHVAVANDNNNNDDVHADDNIEPVVCCPVAPELMDQAVNMWHPTPRKSSCFSCSQNGSPVGSLPNGCNQDRAPLKLLCDTMKYQIISRAFYGCEYMHHEFL